MAVQFINQAPTKVVPHGLDGAGAAEAINSAGGSLYVNAGFAPSNYSADKSATTTVTGQSEAIASGTGALRVRNLGPTNFARIAFGTSANDAETNAANGVAIPAGAVEVLGVPANATHYAWLGDTGTVTLNIQQGA